MNEENEDDKPKFKILRQSTRKSPKSSQNVYEDFFSNDFSKLSKKEKDEKLERVKYREYKKPWLIYPENTLKVNWDLFITSILLASCIITPYRIAFGEIQEPVHWQAINFFIDCCFLIDIVIMFNSVYYDDDFEIIEDRKKIALTYLQSWFLIDLLAIIPFDLFVNDQESTSTNFNDFARVVRLGKISRLIKMTRLLRILKLMKERSKLLKYLNEILKIGLGFERLVFFVLIFFI